jgi:predicted Zn-dependent protease
LFPDHDSRFLNFERLNICHLKSKILTMRNKILITAALTLFFIACSRVPVTNRKQLNMLPESTMISMALTTYNDFLKSNPPLPSTDPNAEMVERIGRKISIAVTDYMRQNKMSDRIKGYKWEFKTVQSKEMNAWCMPGGKIVVYTGILPVTQDEAGLAFVMGHEIAHAIARHGNERMSQMLVTAMGGIALDVALRDQPEKTRSLYMTAYGVGATVGALLPFSRLHESEADKMGLIFMAMAGYNPSAAVGLWERFAKATGNNKPPEFLSTHPSDQNRIKDIKAFLPKAMKYYRPQ